MVSKTTTHIHVKCADIGSQNDKVSHVRGVASLLCKVTSISDERVTVGEYSFGLILHFSLKNICRVHNVQYRVSHGSRVFHCFRVARQ